MIQLYTDGSSLGNPGPGGYGVVLVEDGIAIREYSRGYDETTNNRMEVMGALRALYETSGDIEIISDSSYVVNGFTQWLPKWVKKRWKSARGVGVKNSDLWKLGIKLLAGRKVKFTWVRGHDGNKFNEIADKLAVKAANNPEKKDTGYIAQ